MQLLEVSGAVRPTYGSLGVKRLIISFCLFIRWNGFGGVGVACWPLVPKFEGSNPAADFGFLGRKNPQHAFLLRGSKAVGPMS